MKIFIFFLLLFISMHAYAVKCLEVKRTLNNTGLSYHYIYNNCIGTIKGTYRCSSGKEGDLYIGKCKKTQVYCKEDDNVGYYGVTIENFSGKCFEDIESDVRHDANGGEDVGKSNSKRMDSRASMTNPKYLNNNKSRDSINSGNVKSNVKDKCTYVLSVSGPNGGVGTYVGNCISGVANGQGRLNLSDGTIVTGNFYNGEPSGEVTYKFTDGLVFSGNFVDGSMNGQVRIQYANGNTYEGNVINNRPQGIGIHRSTNGDWYKGEFRNGKEHGQGVFHYADGYWYEGEFRNGKQHGQGVFHFTDGRKLVGKFREGVFYDGYSYTIDGHPCKIINRKPLDKRCVFTSPWHLLPVP